MHKIVKIIAAIFGVLGVAFLFLILLKGDETIKDQYFADGITSAIDPMYLLGVIIFFLATLITLIFVLKGVASGNIKKTLISLGLFVGVILLSYIIADSSQVISSNNTVIATEGSSISKWVSTGIYTTIILIVIAIGTMVWGTFSKVKN